MYLKSLKLVGFKSFADRVRLELRPGVTVVVGPNGSGKSNLVDAVSWVLGSQSPRSLRTPKMEDVVFAGTATRPAHGRAEVTVVFDNESRQLPLDLDEVSVTRRLYRDGSSDYELNGVGCRLLDISELLADSGVGRHQHIIVGQGQIDSILNSGPAEHRAVIEEAAGVLKHRQRKERALRRLERTDADLLRLGDILGELSRQMRPLRRQAEAAHSHAELVDRRRALRLYLGGEELRDFDRRRAAIGEEQATLQSAVVEGEVEVAELGAAVAILTTEASEVGRRLDRDTAAAARLETILERFGRLGAIARERRRAITARHDGMEERRHHLEEEAVALEAEIEEVAEMLRRAEGEADKAERRFRLCEDEVRSLAGQEGLTPEGALAVVRGEVRSLEAAALRDRREAEALEHRRRAVAAQLGDEEDNQAALKREVQELDEAATLLTERYQRATDERRRRQEHWEAVEGSLAEARLEKAASAARLEALRAAAAGGADPQAVEAVVARRGYLGSLLSRLDVPAAMAAAVDAALGPWAEGVVMADPASLEEAVAALKADGLGGMALVSVPPAAATPSPPVPGVDALIDLLGPDADSALAASLLGDVVVVEGWQAAMRFIAAHPHLRVVTPEGDLVTANGVRAAHPDGATPAMLEAAEVALERADTELARIESLAVSSRRDFERARSVERESLEALEGVEAKLSGATEALHRVIRNLASLTSEADRLAARGAALREAVAEREAALGRLRETLEALEGQEAERQRAWEEMEARRAALEGERERARAEWQRSAEEVRARRERLGMLVARRDVVLAALDEEVGQAPSEAELERLDLVADLARRAAQVMATRLEELRTRQAGLRARARAATGQMEAARARHEAARAGLEQARRRLGELVVEETELRVRREGVVEALRREIDAGEEEALAAPRPCFDGLGEDLAVAVEEVEARLRRIGPVNPLAAEEYAELSARHAFLSEQLADLESSRSELKRVIEALESEIRDQFAAAYAEVAAAYQENFAVLFPGGVGRLSLTDPEDLGSSGVEIGAQPLGKKVSQLSLLSGGERSLAALAFLFAVFKARPSPFYILDEVEAALDDANLRRFLRLVDAFRAEAQLIIVTHQQQTMEAADVLYGVTMEPGGSSRVVRKEMRRHALPRAGSMAP